MFRDQILLCCSYNFPAFCLAERSSLLDSHLLSEGATIQFIVRIELRRSFIAFLVFWMNLVGVNGYNDGFVHLNAGNGTGLCSHWKIRVKKIIRNWLRSYGVRRYTFDRVE